MKTAYRIYRPQHPKASVFIIHGMEEHKERYVPFAQYLCDHDIGVLIYDLPGHGDIPKEDMGWFGEKELEGFIKAARVHKKTAALVWLLRLKDEKYGYKDRDFSL